MSDRYRKGGTGPSKGEFRKPEYEGKTEFDLMLEDSSSDERPVYVPLPDPDDPSIEYGPANDEE